MGRVKQGLLIGGWLLSGLAMADQDAENAALKRASMAIEQLQPILREAQQQSDERAAVQFRYDQLQHDLRLIREGIERHITAPRRYPNPIEPLDGDYRAKSTAP